MDMTWSQWPSDVPRPTEEEWKLAEVRYHDEQDALMARLAADGKDYMGDTGYSLGFDMATVNRECWWHYFFPYQDLRPKFLLGDEPNGGNMPGEHAQGKP